MRLSDFLDDVGRPVAYYPKLAIFLGSVNAAVLLCQLFYWEGKQEDEAGWIFKTQKEITDETGLSRRESDSARRILREKEILADMLRGVPPKIHFLLKRDALDDLWDTWRKAPNQFGGKRQIDLAENASTSWRKAPNQFGLIGQNIDQRSLPETTREHTHTDASPPVESPPKVGVCVHPDLTLQDYLRFARSKPSFEKPDAWAMTHFPLRDADYLVIEALYPERLEAAAAVEFGPPREFTDRECSHCFGAKFETVEGKGTRPCTHCIDERGRRTGREPKQDEAAPSETTGGGKLSLGEAEEIVESMLSIGRDAATIIADLPLDDDVRERLTEFFVNGGQKGEHG